MCEEKNKKIKEDDNMAMAIKPNEASVIKKDKLSAFLKEVSANKVTKEYWNECIASRDIFSSSDIEQMKRMCSRESN